MAQASGWPEPVRRSVAARVASGIVEGFRPELIVTDTFPSGPHGELHGLIREVPRRVLVRRSVRSAARDEGAAGAGLEDYELAILPDDPDEQQGASLTIPCVRVPPITLFEAHDAVDRATARATLGLPRDGRIILVASGGGGDANAAALAAQVAAAIGRMPDGPRPVLAVGPLGDPAAAPAGIARVSVTPLQPLLAAFDGAIAAAGYNSAHELAKAGVPAALYAMPRPFDDQSARAARFARAGLARVLASFDDDAIREAVQWMVRAPPPTIAAGGAEGAAGAILDMLGRAAA